MYNFNETEMHIQVSTIGCGNSAWQAEQIEMFMYDM